MYLKGEEEPQSNQLASCGLCLCKGAPPKKCSFKLDFVHKGGGSNAIQKFWDTFCVVFHQNQGKKCPKTFGFGPTPPPCWCTKSVPKLLDCLGSPPPFGRSP